MKRHRRPAAREPFRSIFRRNSRRQPRWQPRVESLESRHLLAANVLADATGTVAAAGSSELEMHVELPDAPAGAVAHLGIRTANGDGSTLDPAAVTVLDSSGAVLVPFSSLDDAPISDGMTVIGLPAGDFTLSVAGDDAVTSGAFHLEVMLLGDTLDEAGNPENTGQVSQHEYITASAAAVQALGTGNFNTALFYRSMGVDLGIDQYDSGMDANVDGIVSSAELALIQANSGLGMVHVELQSDAGAPAISGVQLRNDTGVSDTDGITTDPTIEGQISDDSLITAFTAVLDGGAEFDLTTLFDPNVTGDFTLDAADLDAIAGGPLTEGVHTLTLSATDELGNTVDPPVSLTFTFIGTNEIPTVNAIEDQTATEDLPFTLGVGGFFADANAGDVLTFSTGALPSWLSFDASTATFTGIPANDDVGTVDITVTAADSQGASVSDTFSLTVDNVNDAPTLADIGNQTATEDESFSLDLNTFAADVDAGDTVTITAQGLPAWLSLSAGVLSGTPANGDVGSVTIVVTATDSQGAAATDSFQLTVNNVNDPPTLVAPIADQNVQQNEPFSLGLVVFFQDEDAGDSLTIDARLSDGSALPAWLSFDPVTGSLTGTPGNDDVGQYSVEATATDTAGASVSDIFVIDVGNVNDPPIATPIADADATEEQAFNLDVSGNFSDPDPGDSFTLSARLADDSDLPAWLSFNPATGVFSGTPGNLDVGTLSIKVTATDLAGLSTSDTFTLEVINVNDDPTLVNATDNQEVDQDANFSLDVSDAFADEDPGDTLTLSATLVGGAALPAWLDFNPNTGLFSGTPTNADVGTISIELTATDTAAATASDTFDITVNNVNDDPVVANQEFSVDPDVPVGTVVGTILASDPDGDNLSFAIVSGNAGGTFALDSDTGEITVANTAGLIEDTTIVFEVEVTDDGVPVLSTTAQVSVNVIGNLPPDAVDDPGFTTRDDTTLTIDAGDLLANDTDPDVGDTLVVTQVNATSQRGASVELDGTDIVYNPATSQELLALHDGEQLVDTFQYTVSDGNGGTDTATVTVTVDGTDTVQFVLRTTDADGNEITQVQTGQSFELRVFVQDIRDNPTGAFSAYLDVTYPATSASTVGGIMHSTTYGAGTSGSLTPGLLDEVGGVDGITALGGNEFELFRVEFQAGAVPGEVVFASDPAEDQVQHIVTVFDMTSAAVNPLQVIYGTTSINVTGPGAALSARASLEADPLDVNGDHVVSPLDALLIIGRLGNDAAAAGSLVDVNGDGATTPLDALLVIGRLGESLSVIPRAAMSAHASLADSTAATAVLPAEVESSLPAAIAQSVDVVFADLGDTPGSSQEKLAAVTAKKFAADRWNTPEHSDTDAIEADLVDLDNDLFRGF